MAIYNKVTQPLNAAYTGKMQRTSYLLILIPFIVLFSPLPFVAIGSWWLNRPGLTDAALSFPASFSSLPIGVGLHQSAGK